MFNATYNVSWVFSGNNQSQNADVEIQQRAIEYLRLTSVASTDVLATVLEEMPPFPERESSILAKLKKKKPEAIEGGDIKPSQASKMPAAQISSLPLPTETESKPPEQQAADLLGLSTPATNPTPPSANSVLIDVFEATQAAGQTFKQNGIHTISADEGFNKFVFKNSGVLLENDMMQIGVKSEYKRNYGRLMVFYGNKTTFQIIGFNATVVTGGNLDTALHVQVLRAPHHYLGLSVFLNSMKRVLYITKIFAAM
ncbi:AP2A2 [Bugula neritina]|uniref:AP2A2 n=1 Tax=Bugula neritina TaxID=10212 RepID=A0A7J7J3T0_BUGNE|nr:AP2A2 [Bugula neritina]